MNEAFSNPAERSGHPGIWSWAVLPLSFFPLVALLTYDWHSIAALNTPPVASANWIGPLGDAFAYYGYLLLGLAIWIVPLASVIAATCLLRSRRLTSPAQRRLWLIAFTLCTACLLQSVGANASSVNSLVARLNIQNPGGAVGYLLTTRLLAPLVSDFGAAMIVALLLVISFIGAVGIHNLSAICRDVRDWVANGTRRTPEDEAAAALEREQLAAADEARRAAKEAARLDKIRVKNERAEAKRLAKEAARASAAAETAVPAPLPAATAASAAADETAAPDKGPYRLPSLDLLAPLKKSTADHSDVSEMSQKLVDTLKLFDVNATLAYTVQGPVVTKYALNPDPGTRPEKFLSLQNTLMMALKAKSMRIEAPIPGEDKIGIEVPNRAPAGISFREIIESPAWKSFKGELPLLFGKDAAGKELIADLASMPHMLVAGATGQGKSVCLNAIINGLLMTKTPQELKLIMVDPKSVEFASYASLPHLIVPVITDNKKVVFSLHWAVAEMEKRLKLFSRAHVKNIYDFNHRPSFTQTDMFGNDAEVGSDMPKTIPYIVIIIDEVADLMASNGKEVTPDIARLTAKARAAGIHLILATQRPDAKIITGTIKANIPGRVAFKTAQAIDSRTILDDAGAENLIGRGDMLFKGKDGLLTRAQGAWISDAEIANVVSFIEQHSNVQFDDRFAKKLGTIKDEEIDLYGDNEQSATDDKAAAQAAREQVKAAENASDFKKAIECVINTNRASISHFQRRLGWGYNHSAKIVDMLEDAGVIAPAAGAGPRSIVMDQQQLLNILNGDEPGVESTDAASGEDVGNGEDNLSSTPTETLP